MSTTRALFYSIQYQNHAIQRQSTILTITLDSFGPMGVYHSYMDKTLLYVRGSGQVKIPG